MKIETVGTWSGTNFGEIISALFSCNENLRIRQQGTKLIIKDPHVDYYACIAAGDDVEIPMYEQPIRKEEEEEAVLSKAISKEQIELLKSWGLFVEAEL